jgi:hypothetical protein
MNESTFSTFEVHNFLNQIGGFPYAAGCWLFDKSECLGKERVSHSETYIWFRYMFSDPNDCQFYFRLMEVHCSQFSEL